jgi:hypothetical protein
MMKTSMEKQIIRRISMFCLFFLCAFSLSSESHHASGRVLIAPRPAWVEDIKPDLEAEAPTRSSSDGSFFLIVDTQSNVELESDYYHYAVRILSETGVQASSSVSAEWDPSFQSLSFHSIVRVREGKAEELLGPDSFRVIQREENLEGYMFDGSLSAICFLEDVRKGDVIEYSYTVRGRNPVFSGRYSDSRGMGFSVPVGRLRHRVVHPLSRPLSRITLFGNYAPSVTRGAADEDIVWDIADLPAIIGESGIPSWFSPYPFVELSEYGDWDEVARWARGIFDPRSNPGAGVRRLAERIKGENAEREGRILAAVRFVQDEVRYLGIEIGVYSHTPNDPGTVLARRYGDCKDKALLLCALLREIGEKAYPALVDTDSGRRLADSLPSPYAFNHAVCALDMDGRRIFIDPTISHQRGGLDSLYFPDYRKALVLDGTGQGLSDIPVPAPGGIRVNEDFLLSQDEGGKDVLSVLTLFSGPEADDMRFRLSSESPESSEKLELEYYARIYPGIARIGEREIDDDQASNQIRVMDRYELSLSLSPSGRTIADFSSGDVGSRLVLPASRGRSMPYDLGRPVSFSQRVRLSPLEGNDFKSEEKRIQNPFFDFSYSSGRGDSALMLAWDLEIIADHVPAGECPAFYDDADEALDWADRSVDLGHSRGGPPLPDPAEALCVVLAFALGILLISRVMPRTRDLPAANPRTALGPAIFACLLAQAAGLAADIALNPVMRAGAGSGLRGLALILDASASSCLFAFCAVCIYRFVRRPDAFPRAFMAKAGLSAGLAILCLALRIMAGEGISSPLIWLKASVLGLVAVEAFALSPSMRKAPHADPAPAPGPREAHAPAKGESEP